MSGLFDYNVNLQPAVMDIRSETLEPISSSSTRYVFRLDQAGQLDANSMLLFKPVLQAGANGNETNTTRVNPYGGGLLAIKRATFQVGDYILNDTVDIGRISNLVDMGTVQSSNNSHYNSHYFQNNFHTKIASTGGTVAGINTEVQNGGVGSYMYDRRRSAMDFGARNSAFAGAKVNNCIITANKDNNAQIGIPLGNLFPCLKGQELPLFLFQDYRILLTIEFHTADKWCNNSNAHNSGFTLANSVLAEDVKLQVDYIIYPSEVQNAQREQTNAQGGLTLAFPDIIKIEKNIGATGALPGVEQSVEHRLGMDNREVHKIYMLKQLSHAAKAEDQLLANARCDGMNQEEYNVNIDGVDVFQEFKYGPNSQYDETTNCLGGDLQVVRPMYFNDENTIVSKLADENSGLLGRLKPLCLDLTNGNPGVVGAGRQIGAYPIIWKYKRRPCNNLINCFPDADAAKKGRASVSQNLRGALNVDYFVYVSRTANIKSSPSGTMVMVSY